MRLGKKEKEFLKELQKAGGEAALYTEIAPKLYYLKSLKYVYYYINAIANRLEEKGLVKNIYKGKYKKHYVRLIKNNNNNK